MRCTPARMDEVKTQSVSRWSGIVADFEALRLHDMASTWADLIGQHDGELDSSRWLVEQMLRAETTEQATRSIGHQVTSAKFPAHRDLARFDFEVSSVERKLPGAVR